MYLKYLLLVLSSAVPATGPGPATLMSRFLLSQSDSILSKTSRQYDGRAAQCTKMGVIEEIFEAQPIGKYPQEFSDQQARSRAVQSIYQRADLANSTPYRIMMVLTRIEMAETLSKRKTEDQNSPGAQGSSAAETESGQRDDTLVPRSEASKLEDGSHVLPHEHLDLFDTIEQLKET